MIAVVSSGTNWRTIWLIWARNTTLELTILEAISLRLIESAEGKRWRKECANSARWLSNLSQIVDLVAQPEETCMWDAIESARALSVMLSLILCRWAIHNVAVTLVVAQCLTLGLTLCIV